eukprot:gene1524-4674_t
MNGDERVNDEHWNSEGETNNRIRNCRGEGAGQTPVHPRRSALAGHTSPLQTSSYRSLCAVIRFLVRLVQIGKKMSSGDISDISTESCCLERRRILIAQESGIRSIEEAN